MHECLINIFETRENTASSQSEFNIRAANRYSTN